MNEQKDKNVEGSRATLFDKMTGIAIYLANVVCVRDIEEAGWEQPLQRRAS